jgi:hypothetical protein
MLAASTAGRFFFVPFVLLGVAMLVWNERLTKAMIAGNRAVVKELGITPLQRVQEKLERQRWFVPALRIYTVLFALVWTGICVAGLIGG